jgi:hypothetical protein
MMMSKSRVESWNASRIGEAVAKKAFAHMTDPLDAVLRDALEAAYWQEIADCGLTRKAHDALLARRTTGYQHTTLVWRTPEDNDRAFEVWVKGFEHGHNKDNSDLPSPFLCQRLYMHNKDTLVPVEAAMDALRPWNEKKSVMANEIAVQIKDRTVTVVLKAWPEIKPFVYDIMGITPPENASPTPVPFQDLLNKHLLALPAPTPAKPAMVKRRRTAV